MTPAEDAQWQDKLASAITRAIPGAVVTFTTAGEPYPSCGHQHTGPELGEICVGCACPGQDAALLDEDAAEIALRQAEREVVRAASAWEWSTAGWRSLSEPPSPAAAANTTAHLDALRVATRAYRVALDARVEAGARATQTQHAQS